MAYCAVYLNRIYRERDRPEKAENPLVLEKDIPVDAGFSYIDFVPSCLSYNTNDVEFHRFHHLIDTANEWLAKNPQWRVVNCETVRLVYKHNLTNMVSRWEQQINPTAGQWTAAAYRGGEFVTSLKVLRIWIRRNDDEDADDDDDGEVFNKSDEQQQQQQQSEQSEQQDKQVLKYLDFVPQRINGNNFETIDSLVARLNERLKESDAQKWILVSIQSLRMEVNSDWNLINDLQSSLAEESSRYIVILRMYYQEWTVNEQLWKSPFTIDVGVEDFRPRHLSGGSFFKRPQFEPFASLVQRAGRWLTSQQNVQFLNAQSIDIKVKSFTKIDSRSTSHIENGDYIQILRVAYCRLTPRSPEPSTSSQADLSFFPVPDCFHALTSAATSLKLGSKAVLTTKFEHPLDSLQHRINDWLSADSNLDVCPLSAETVDIFAKDDDENKLERMLEDCFQSNRLGNLNTYAFTGIRMFYCILPEQSRPLNELNRSRSAQSLVNIESPNVQLTRKCSKRRASTKPATRSSKAVRLKHQQTLTTIELGSNNTQQAQTHLVTSVRSGQYEDSPFSDLIGSDTDMSPPPIRQRSSSNSCTVM